MYLTPATYHSCPSLKCNEAQRIGSGSTNAVPEEGDMKHALCCEVQAFMHLTGPVVGPAGVEVLWDGAWDRRACVYQGPYGAWGGAPALSTVGCCLGCVWPAAPCLGGGAGERAEGGEHVTLPQIMSGTTQKNVCTTRTMHSGGRVEGEWGTSGVSGAVTKAVGGGWQIGSKRRVVLKEKKEKKRVRTANSNERSRGRSVSWLRHGQDTRPQKKY